MQVLEQAVSLDDQSSGVMLPGILAAIVEALQKHRHACGLTVISAAIQAFQRDATQQQVIQDAFKQAYRAVAPSLQVPFTACILWFSHSRLSLGAQTRHHRNSAA